MTQKTSKGQSPLPPPPANKAYEKRRGKKKFRKYPHCMYFYYVNQNAPNQGDAVQHYYHTNSNEVIEPDDVSGLIIDLFRNARDTRLNPPQFSSGMDYFVWTRKSYVVFLVDEPQFTFDNQDAFDFYDSTAPNHTFFDAWDGKMTIDGRQVAVCYCINHMKSDDDAGELGDDHQPVRFRLKGNPISFIRRLPNSGGTNQGPPVPPPE